MDNQLVYVSFNRYVIALDRKSGKEVWEWRASQGSGYVAILVDGNEIFASCRGYTYCLDAQTGEQLWYNYLNGRGMGIACLATAHANTQASSGAAAQMVADNPKQQV